MEEQKEIKHNEHLDQISERQHEYKKKDFFQDWEEVNNFELELPHTKKKLVTRLMKKSYGNGDQYILKLNLGYSSLFFDAYSAFTVAEIFRHLTEDVVPDKLKPKRDRLEEIQKEQELKSRLKDELESLQKEKAEFVLEKEAFEKLKGEQSG